MKKRAKMLAFLLGATMMVGSTMTAAAESPAPAFTGKLDTTTTTGDASVTAPIYSMSVTDVLVPTTFKMAFNPDGANVTVGSDTKTDQVISLSYGVLNKSTSDKKLSIAFKLEDQNEGKKITMASSKDEVTNAEDGAYVIYVEAVPGTGITASSNAIDSSLDTAVIASVTAAALGDVTISTPSKDDAVSANGGTLVFALQESTYDLGSKEIVLGTDNANDVESKFTLSKLGDASAAGFTFDGAMSDANWSALSSGVKLTATYSIKDVKTEDYGVYAMFTANENGSISFDTDRVSAISKVEFYKDAASDTKYTASAAYKNPENTKETLWKAGSTANGVFTPTAECLTYCADKGVDKVLITYTTGNGTSATTATATLDISTSQWGK